MGVETEGVSATGGGFEEATEAHAGAGTGAAPHAGRAAPHARTRAGAGLASGAGSAAGAGSGAGAASGAGGSVAGCTTTTGFGVGAHSFAWGLNLDVDAMVAAGVRAGEVAAAAFGEASAGVVAGDAGPPSGVAACGVEDSGAGVFEEGAELGAPLRTGGSDTTAAALGALAPSGVPSATSTFSFSEAVGALSSPCGGSVPSSKPVAGLLAGLDPAIDAQEGIGFDASATRRDGGVVDGAGDRIYLCLRRKSASSMRVIFRDAKRANYCAGGSCDGPGSTAAASAPSSGLSTAHVTHVLSSARRAAAVAAASAAAWAPYRSG